MSRFSWKPLVLICMAYGAGVLTVMSESRSLGYWFGCALMFVAGSLSQTAWLRR